MNNNTTPSLQQGSTGIIYLILAIVMVTAGALWWGFSGSDTANDNANTANSVAMNENVNVNENTNTVTNENTNTNSQVNGNTNAAPDPDEVDTSGWLTYTHAYNESPYKASFLGTQLSFRYPSSISVSEELGSIYFNNQQSERGPLNWEINWSYWKELNDLKESCMSFLGMDTFESSEILIDGIQSILIENDEKKSICIPFTSNIYFAFSAPETSSIAHALFVPIAQTFDFSEYSDTRIGSDGEKSKFVHPEYLYKIRFQPDWFLQQGKCQDPPACDFVKLFKVVSILDSDNTIQNQITIRQYERKGNETAEQAFLRIQTLYDHNVNANNFRISQYEVANALGTRFDPLESKDVLSVFDVTDVVAVVHNSNVYLIGRENASNDKFNEFLKEFMIN